jgi:hypothetical protein
MSSSRGLLFRTVFDNHSSDIRLDIFQVLPEQMFSVY